MAATRLRKTFHYPADNSDEDDMPKDLDEEEQEKYIKRLREEDDERNEEYKVRIFLAIPTISATAYIPALLVARVFPFKLISLLSITSLLTTAYILAFVPNTRSEPPQSANAKVQPMNEEGLVHKYIIPLNGCLSFLLALNSFTIRNKDGVHEGFWILCLLPIVSFSINLLARRLMLSVDVDELENLKYSYKGA